MYRSQFDVLGATDVNDHNKKTRDMVSLPRQIKNLGQGPFKSFYKGCLVRMIPMESEGIGTSIE